MLQLGLDIGGTKIEGLVLDANGEQVFRKRIPTVKSSYQPSWITC